MIHPMGATKRAHVLVIAKRSSACDELAQLLERANYTVSTLESSRLDATHVAIQTYDLIVVELDEEEGFSSLSQLGAWQRQRVIAIIPAELSDEASRLARSGLARYLIRPVHPDEILQAVNDQLEIITLRGINSRLTDQLRSRYHTDNIIGISPGARSRRSFIRAFADIDQPVFVSGERGVGKQMIARTLHYSSWRALFPFIFLDTAQLPAEALELLLFGDQDHSASHGWFNRGLIEVARGSTIYVSEISHVPTVVQLRIAAVIRDSLSESVDEGRNQGPGIRFVFGSHSSPESLRKKGTLVDELYQQVCIAHLAIEPLRHRLEDIPLFVERFLQEIVRAYGKEAREFTEDALEALKRYDWPENLSQLKDVVYAAVMKTRPQPIDVDALPEPVGRKAPAALWISFPEEGLDFYKVVENFERALVQKALRLTGGNQRRAAKLLHLKETTFAAMRKRLQATGNRDVS